MELTRRLDFFPQIISTSRSWDIIFDKNILGGHTHFLYNIAQQMASLSNKICVLVDFQTKLRPRLHVSWMIENYSLHWSWLAPLWWKVFYWLVIWFGLRGVLQTLDSDWQKCQQNIKWRIFSHRNWPTQDQRYWSWNQCRKIKFLFYLTHPLLCLSNEFYGLKHLMLTIF